MVLWGSRDTGDDQRNNNYLLLHCGLLLAPLKPGFSLSLLLGSLLRSPYGFIVTLSPVSITTNALANANFMLSECPLRPPQHISISAS